MATTSGTTPESVEAQLRRMHSDEWLAELAVRLASPDPLHRIRDTWHLTNAELGAVFSVTRQAVSRWLRDGVPARRKPEVATMARATDLLLHHLKPERIPTVVRRAVPARDDESLYDIATSGRRDDVLDAVREMFAFERVSA